MDEEALRIFKEDMRKASLDVEENLKDYVSIDNDSDYDTDIDIPEPVPTPYDQWGKRTYLRVCRKVKIAPIASVLRDLEIDKMDLMHRGLTENDILAITSCLLDNAYVKSLNLEGNPLSPKACHYLYLGLKENLNIEHLNLRNTSMNHRTTPIIARLLMKNDNLKTVNLAENNFDDEDIKHLELIIEETRSIEHLDLSHNNLGKDSSFHIGHTLANNDSIRSLNLSWNMFNAHDAMHICKGIQENVKLTTLNLAMNGIANKGVQHFQELLKNNITLTELDLSCNRISDKGAYVLGKALEQNETLKVLKLSKNPLTNIGVMGVMNGIKKNETSVMQYLNVVSVSLFQSAIELYTEVKELHPRFKLIHGQVLDDLTPAETPRIQEEADEEDPMHTLKYHLIAKRRRLIEYFKQGRVGGDGFISKEQFKDGIKAMKIPLTTAHINKLGLIIDDDESLQPNFAKLILKQGEVIDLPQLPADSDEDDEQEASRPKGPSREHFLE